jgi:hypothetical protein
MDPRRRNSDAGAADAAAAQKACATQIDEQRFFTDDAAGRVFLVAVNPFQNYLLQAAAVI